jgi:hypothetical protein
MSAMITRVVESIIWLIFGVLLHWLWTFHGGGDLIELFKEGLEDSSSFARMNETSATTSSIVIDTKQAEMEVRPFEEEEEDKTEKTFRNNISPFRFNSSVKFLFVMGLEGTGHHLVSSIVTRGPEQKRVSDLGVKNSRAWIHQWLFHSAPQGDGLWDAHCAGHDVDTGKKQADIMKKMEGINRHVAGLNKTTKLLYFMNTVDPFDTFGMVSYPNFAKECRFLDYPNLDLWYNLCDAAKVDCEHVYLYRDPPRILYSTVDKRGFNPTLMYAIDLYTTMYHVVAGQLETYANRTIGCYGLFENTTDSWYEGMRELAGWGNTPEKRQEYQDSIDELYQPSPANKSWVIPSNLDLYMKPLFDLHDRVIRICQDGLETNKK